MRNKCVCVGGRGVEAVCFGHKIESYLKHMSPTVRRIMCKFRKCNHKLPVESGQVEYFFYLNAPNYRN